jgi:hypothetical protein
VELVAKIGGKEKFRFKYQGTWKENVESKTAPLNSKGPAPALGAYDVDRLTNGIKQQIVGCACGALVDA